MYWGYGLPPTDFHSSWLFRQVNRSLDSVAIVNPACVRKHKTSTTWNYTFLRQIALPFRERVNAKSVSFFDDFDNYAASRTVDSIYGLHRPSTLWR